MKQHYLILFCAAALTFFCPISPEHNSRAFAAKENTSAAAAKNSKADRTWNTVYNRLLKDGFSKEELRPFFKNLQNAYTQKPMGSKVKELYAANFAPQKKSPEQSQNPKSSPLGIPYPWYDGFVTEENALKCQTFIKNNEKYFAQAEKQYSVPKEVLSALIYVETQHGQYLGKFQALPILASMAASTDLAMLPDYAETLHLTPKQKKWMQKKIREKADWAYTELKALLHYSLQNNIDVSTIPSSVYGAIGYGQFMPSNIARYGIDGNKDGKTDPFNLQDAIPSIANFLHKQGWTQKDLPFAKQVKILKRYNNSTAYAHTILALAKLTEQEQKQNSDKNKENT